MKPNFHLLIYLFIGTDAFWDKYNGFQTKNNKMLK